MKFKYPYSIIDLITMVTVLGFFLLIRISNSPDQSSPIQRADTRADKFLLSVKPIPDTISHKNYQRLLDSAKLIQTLQNGELANFVKTKLGDIIATSKAMECDSCRLVRFPSFSSTHIPHDAYYLDLRGWTLKNPVEHHKSYDLSMFYVKNGVGYIRGVEKDKPVKFRYDHETGQVLIPISKSAWNTLNIVFIVIRTVGILWFIYLIICGFLFLKRISKGYIFTNGNLHCLLVIAVTLLALPILKLGSNYLLKFIFKGYFTDALMVNRAVYDNLWIFLFSGLVILRLYQAFAAGKQLKEEQELTI